MFAFFLFLRPGFLLRFCPRHLSFRWIHSVSFHGLYIKKIRWFQRPKQRETGQCKLNMQMFIIKSWIRFAAKFNGIITPLVIYWLFSKIVFLWYLAIIEWFQIAFFHQTLNHYFSYIGSKEKNFRKIWPLKVYSNLNLCFHFTVAVTTKTVIENYFHWTHVFMPFASMVCAGFTKKTVNHLFFHWPKKMAKIADCVCFFQK